ncbi:MAG: hypothetical protein H6721_08845 [Sandaracinus sp.]|nr:hypothetical protein [Sandaracinus sp.]
MTLRRFALLLACFVPALAHAQLHREGSGPSLPAVTTSAPDGALALEANPGALAFTSGWELAYVHADRLGDATLSERGDTVAGVLPLPLRLAVAASVDWVRPTEGSSTGGSLSVSVGRATSGSASAVRCACSRATDHSAERPRSISA